MKRLIVIAEGETEASFVNNVLCPYFYAAGIYNAVQCFKTKHSGGGLSKYSYIRQDIVHALYESEAVVTTMIDFYRLPSDFPGYKQLNPTAPHQEHVAFLEARMKEDIENMQNRRFENLIPYIQLHEFEALLFSSSEGIAALFERNEYDYRELERVVRDYSNPEDINNSPDSAPSVRLKRIIPGYDKVVYGIEILKAIGMSKVLAQCPRFRMWIENLLKSLR